MSHSKKFSVAVLTLGFLLLGLNLCCSAGNLVTYQGKLTSASGQVLPDGDYWVGIRVWDVASGGTIPLWARKYQVPVTNGLFSMMLGAEGTAWENPVPLTSSLKLAISSGNRYLEITVMSDADGPEKSASEWQTLQPRQQLNAVPYAMNGVPTGTVVPFAGSTAPDGWVICDGATTLPIADPRYSRLHDMIGNTFNDGNEPSGHFRVPDLRGRTAIGSGQGDTWMPGGVNQSTDWALGQKFGAEKHQLTIPEMPRHNHGVNDPGHSHESWGTHGAYTGGGKPVLSDPSWQQGRTTVRSAVTGITIQNNGSDLPHNNMQPSLVLNYIIKL